MTKKLSVTKAQEKEVKGLGFLRNRGTDNFSGRVLTVNGVITAAQQQCIGKSAEKFGNGNVCLTSRMSIEVQGIPYEKIPDFREYLRRENLETGGTGAKVRPVVSCKGSTCQFGLIDTFGLSRHIHDTFFLGYGSLQLPHKFKIGVGGCPNSCIKPDLNDVGIVGRRKPVVDNSLCKNCRRCAVEIRCPMDAATVVDGTLEIDEQRCIHCGLCVGHCPFGVTDQGKDGYKIYIGGRWGKAVARGQLLDCFFTDARQVMEMVEKIILLYADQGVPGQRLSQMIAELGFENVEKELLTGDILSRKDAIVDAHTAQ